MPNDTKFPRIAIVGIPGKGKGVVAKEFILLVPWLSQRDPESRHPPMPRDLTFWRAKMAWPSANWLFWRELGRLVGQADLLTPIKAHAILSAWPANINFNENVE
jgi:hypothetical protein